MLALFAILALAVLLFVDDRIYVRGVRRLDREMRANGCVPVRVLKEAHDGQILLVEEQRPPYRVQWHPKGHVIRGIDPGLLFWRKRICYLVP